MGASQEVTAVENIVWPALWPILWLVCVGATIVAAALASRGRRWLLVGRAGAGLLFTVGGAIMHVVNLATGGDYAGFADTAHFAWVTDTWRAVVAPNQLLWISFLVVFEATVGALILSGGRRTQLGYVAVMAFYLALWLFGWAYTLWIVVMLPPMVLLLRAERRAMTAAPPAAPVEDRPLTGVGS